MSSLETIEVCYGDKADAAVIWLHGLGADGHDFAALLPELNLPDSFNVRFIFPHAPDIPVTCNGGYIMRAWYDIYELSVDRRINEAHLQESVHAIRELIEREQARGIPSERIVLAGFSQGGAVAYQAALSHPDALAGLLAMSTYIADLTSLPAAAVQKHLPILVQHGSFDPVVLEEKGKKACEWLLENGYQVSYQRYPAEHHLCPQQVEDISLWLQERLTP